MSAGLAGHRGSVRAAASRISIFADPRSRLVAGRVTDGGLTTSRRVFFFGNWRKKGPQAARIEQSIHRPSFLITKALRERWCVAEAGLRAVRRRSGKTSKQLRTRDPTRGQQMESSAALPLTTITQRRIQTVTYTHRMRSPERSQTSSRGHRVQRGLHRFRAHRHQNHADHHQCPDPGAARILSERGDHVLDDHDRCATSRRVQSTARAPQIDTEIDHPVQVRCRCRRSTYCSRASDSRRR